MPATPDPVEIVDEVQHFVTHRGQLPECQVTVGEDAETCDGPAVVEAVLVCRALHVQRARLCATHRRDARLGWWFWYPWVLRCEEPKASGETCDAVQHLTDEVPA